MQWPNWSVKSCNWNGIIKEKFLGNFDMLVIIELTNIVYESLSLHVLKDHSSVGKPVCKLNGVL